MEIYMLILTGVSLSMDAFAVAVCKGLAMKSFNKRKMLAIAIYFGGFQALMPLLGWTIGKSFSNYIVSISHFIAFALLVLIGGNMIREAIKEKNSTATVEKNDSGIDHKELLLLSIATSIDALAIGVTFAFLNVELIPAITIIGITTFVLSLMAVAIGFYIGAKNHYIASIAGGATLIVLGLKILLEQIFSA